MLYYSYICEIRWPSLMATQSRLSSYDGGNSTGNSSCCCYCSSSSSSCCCCCCYCCRCLLPTRYARRGGEAAGGRAGKTESKNSLVRAALVGKVWRAAVTANPCAADLARKPRCKVSYRRFQNQPHTFKALGANLKRSNLRKRRGRRLDGGGPRYG